MKYNNNGEWKDIIVKATDTLPIGTEVDYDGTNVPDGWEIMEEVKKIDVANTDLDDYKETGWYYFTATYTPLHIPTGTNGTLKVFKSSDTTVKQIWYRRGTLDTTNNEIYVRSFHDDTWSAWGQILVNEYSTSEKRIGTWIDGKPLYRKVYTNLNVTTGISSWTTLINCPANTKKVISVNGISDNGRLYPRYESSSLFLLFDCNSTAVKYVDAGYTDTMTLIIEYTKTTD